MSPEIAALIQDFAATARAAFVVGDKLRAAIHAEVPGQLPSRRWIDPELLALLVWTAEELRATSDLQESLCRVLCGVGRENGGIWLGMLEAAFEDLRLDQEMNSLCACPACAERRAERGRLVGDANPIVERSR
jgi:hypothetical protein